MLLKLFRPYCVCRVETPYNGMSLSTLPKSTFGDVRLVAALSQGGSICTPLEITAPLPERCWLHFYEHPRRLWAFPPPSLSTLPSIANSCFQERTILKTNSHGRAKCQESRSLGWARRWFVLSAEVFWRQHEDTSERYFLDPTFQRLVKYT